MIFALFAILGVVAIFLIWRLSSQRKSLPCPSWLGWMVEMDNPFTQANRTPNILKNLQLSSGMVVLDAGCGPGRLTLPLAETIGPQGKVIALDIQEEMLAKTRKKTELAGYDHVHTLHAGLGSGKLPKDTFDRAVLVTVLGEIPNPLPALKEIYSSLKPGGLLLITEIIFDPHFQSRKKVLQLTSQAGFQEKNFFGKKLAYSLLLEKAGT